MKRARILCSRSDMLFGMVWSALRRCLCLRWGRRLRRASDIAGTYTAVGVEAAAGGGASTIRLQNARGVVLDLQGRTIGLELNANVSGFEISLC
jgi:hypothetical protein